MIRLLQNAESFEHTVLKYYLPIYQSYDYFDRIVSQL